MSRVAFLSLALLSDACVAGGPPAAPGSGDERLFEKLLDGDPTAVPDRSSEPPAGPPPEPAEGMSVDDVTVERIGADLVEAHRLLGEGQTGEPTQVVQRRIIDELSRLVETAKSAVPKEPGGRENPNGAGNPQPESGGSGSPEPSPGQAPTPEAAVGMPSRNRDGKAEESSDRAREDRLRDAVLDFRSDLVRDAWGHLPPRLREQLLNAGSDEYLPQYDSLVRRYFESLAQPESAER